MQNQKKFEKKDEKKTRRRHFFKNLGAIFCAILVIMAFIFESYGPYSKKSSPSQQCKQTKNNLFLSFLNYLSLLYGGLFQNETSQITSSNMLVSRIRKTVVRRQDNKSSQHFNTSLFQENRVFSYLIIPHTFCKN